MIKKDFEYGRENFDKDLDSLVFDGYISFIFFEYLIAARGSI